MLVANLQPAHRAFKGRLRELDDLAYLIERIKKVQRTIEAKEKVDDDVQLLSTELNGVLRALSEVMNENKNVEYPFVHDFREMARDFESAIRAIDDEIFPIETEIARSSRYIPPVIQRTSRRLSKKVIKAMTSGTKYRDYISMASWQRRKYSYRIMCIALAWGLALSGMVLSIAFLTGEFANAQKNLALQVVRTPEVPMQLPAITICSDDHGIPPFTEYPTPEFPGLPLFTISLYLRTNRSLKAPEHYTVLPNTLPQAENSPIESVLVSSGKKFCTKPGFNVNREMNSLLAVSTTGSFTDHGRSSSSCQYCLRIGHIQRELLQPIAREQTAAMFKPAVQILVSKSRMYGICQSSYQFGNLLIDQLIASELLRYAPELEQRGILDFNGQNYSVLSKLLRQYGIAKYADFYCNTYFFSGFFYPSLDNANISYRFTGELPNVWEKVGTGPYFSVYRWDPSHPTIVGPSKEALWRDIYTLGGIRLYAEDADALNSSNPVAPRTEFAVLDRLKGSAVFTFKKMSVLERIEYKVKKTVTHVSEFSVKLVDIFHLGFDFEIFEMEHVYSYSTMTWSEFVTDIFEFIGLFTGICIFTLIVAPANRIKQEE